MSEEINELQQEQLTAAAKISEYRRKLNDLSHRVLKVSQLLLHLIHSQMTWTINSLYMSFPLVSCQFPTTYMFVYPQYIHLVHSCIYHHVLYLSMTSS